MGVVSNVVIYFVYLLITFRGVEPKPAMTIVYVCGASFAFIANRKWTFNHQGDPIKAGLQYGLVHLIGYLLNLLILFALVDRLGYPHQWVQAGAIIVVAGVLFVLFKYIVFLKKD